MTESESVATTTIAVHRGAWEAVCPSLPADVAAMVAPPVTVSSFPVTDVSVAGAGDVRRRAREARFRGNMPSVPSYGRHRRGTT